MKRKDRTRATKSFVPYKKIKESEHKLSVITISSGMSEEGCFTENILIKNKSGTLNNSITGVDMSNSNNKIKNQRKPFERKSNKAKINCVNHLPFGKNDQMNKENVDRLDAKKAGVKMNIKINNNISTSRFKEDIELNSLKSNSRVDSSSIKNKFSGKKTMEFEMIKLLNDDKKTFSYFKIFSDEEIGFEDSMGTLIKEYHNDDDYQTDEEFIKIKRKKKLCTLRSNLLRISQMNKDKLYSFIHNFHYQTKG